MSTAPAFPARPPRFSVTKKYALAVHVESAASQSGETVPGQLLDFSAGGAKVQVETSFRFQQAITVTLDSPDLGWHLSVPAQVCWIRSAGEQWQLGCSFDPAMPHEEIERMVSQGVLDRRRSPRSPVHHAAFALWELNPQPTPVQMVDLSRGGFCLRSPLPAEPNSRLRLQIAGSKESSLELAATVQWRMQDAEGFLLGCSLANADRYAALQQALAATPVPAARCSFPRWLWGALLITAGALSAVVLL